MDQPPDCPRPLRRPDAQALIGLLAVLETDIWMGLEPQDLVEHLRRRLAKDGLLGDGAGAYEFRQALNGLNQRVRFALGEYDKPPTPSPLPS